MARLKKFKKGKHCVFWWIFIGWWWIPIKWVVYLLVADFLMVDPEDM